MLRGQESQASACRAQLQTWGAASSHPASLPGTFHASQAQMAALASNIQPGCGCPLGPATLTSMHRPSRSMRHPAKQLTLQEPANSHCGAGAAHLRHIVARLPPHCIVQLALLSAALHAGCAPVARDCHPVEAGQVDAQGAISGGVAHEAVAAAPARGSAGAGGRRVWGKLAPWCQ